MGEKQNGEQSDWLDAWHVHPTLNREYDVIDGLRGLAILLVVISHLIYVNPAAGNTVKFVGGMFAAGAFGVTIFFTLSGFLISYPFWRRRLKNSDQVVPPGYGWRRFWKIYPPLALSVLVLTPVYILHLGRASEFVTLASEWLVGWPLIHPISGELNPVMWSLVVEVQFYVVLPLLFIALRRVPTHVTLWIVFGSLLIVPTAFRWWYASNEIHPTLHPDIRLNFPSHLDAFAFGVLIAGFENLRWLKRSSARLGTLGFLLLIIFPPLYSWLNLHPVASEPVQTECFGWYIKIISALLLLYIADPERARGGIFHNSWLRWAGLISYEWYLFHQPIILFGRDIFGPNQGNVARYVVMLGGFFFLGLLVAVVVYRYFSLPILRMARRRIAR